MVRGWLLPATFVLGACRASPESTTTPPLERAPTEVRLSPEALLAHTMELQLLHSERLEAQAPSVPWGQRVVHGPRSETRLGPGPEQYRVVVVHSRSRFGTPEELARYYIRAMDKKPRVFHPTRALLRTSVGARETTGESRRSVIERARVDLLRCYVARAARDPRVIVKAPAGLVLQEAHARGLSGIRFSVHVPRAGSTPTVDGATLEGEALTDEDRACLEQAIDDALGGAVVPGGLDTAAVVWTQLAYGPASCGHACRLSHQAATLGWLFRARDDHERALEAFRDAAWAYRLPEYEVLIGMQHEELGRPRHALHAYRTYVTERPDAPDDPEIRRRIARLEGRLAARARRRTGE
jgi:hypothetical protein